ncbi:MAG: hypothetical protein SGBAC_006075 [Bacillariaceae sp.]
MSISNISSASERRMSSRRQYPRVLHFDAESNSVKIPSLARVPDLKPTKVPKEAISSSSEDDDYEPTCQPMHEWQTRTFPVCNNVHEVNMRPESGSVVFINCKFQLCTKCLPVQRSLTDTDPFPCIVFAGGGSRCAFKIRDTGDDWIVLKISKYKKDIDERTFEKARKDGVAMERLQSSAYVLDIFGFCGLSQVIEPGLDGGATHDLIKTTRLRGEDSLPVVDKLKIVYQLASGVADMHTFEKEELVSLVHNDICCHQFIFVDGIYKLNDFHLAHFQTKNKTSNEICKAYNSYSEHYKLIRSPEEISVKVKRPRNQNVLLEKSDVYTLGNVMYHILTMKWLFENQGVSKGIQELMQGRRSPFPERILTSSDRAIRAIRKAIEMCWKHDPEQRPSADMVRNYLGKELKAVLGVEELGVVRVTSIHPLPEGYKYSDSDFRTMFYDD